MNTKNLCSANLMAAAAILGLFSLCESSNAQQPCERTIKANVVALDQAYYNNRLGAFQAGGMIFALRRDVVSTGVPGVLKPGHVMLRADKRPRPMVLRANVGDCLQISFQNLLGVTTPSPAGFFAGVFQAPTATQKFPQNAPPAGGYKPNENATIKQSAPAQTTFQVLDAQPATRLAGVHVMGLELVKAATPAGPLAGVSADGSWVGANDVAAVDPHKLASGLVGPGQSITYTLYAKAEGSYLLYSTAANTGAQLGFGGQLMQGLFGSVTVQPRTAEWYRSQVTKVDLDLASKARPKTSDGHPIVNYNACYPTGADCDTMPPTAQPILKMLNNDNEIVHTDLTAIITGPNHGRFQCKDCPEFQNNPSYPNPTEPWREFAIHYHDDFVSTQAFEQFQKHDDPDRDDPMMTTLQGSRDFFAINYGMDGIGAEIWSNRIGVGPMHKCATCRFEEFFLSAWTVGDPAMVVDYPANSITPGGPANNPKIGPKATKAFFPDDPSNVYHSYMGDHVKFQILHAGTNITHVHHLHAQQWLHSPNNDNSSYRDSQMISPGGSYTLNHTFNGSGNKNKTVGDAIFHCHFYPHFAQGMWSMWRVHDVFEGGTELDKNGRPTPSWNRALPDGEIVAGTPIPALVPLPTLPMAPMPARVKIVPVKVDGTTVGFATETDSGPDPNKANGPGFPFFIPGVAGQRAPHPPLDFAPDEDNPGKLLDGGLPRFLALKEAGTLYEKHNRWDFTKFNDKLKAVELPETGTPTEVVAMKYHATREHNTFLPDGTPANGPNGFLLNGRPPIHGAPYADPAVDLNGKPVCADPTKPPCLRRYKAADIQLDLVFNKKGQHYPQSRMITLWGDVKDTLDNKRAPEPFFFRANSKEVIEYWLANLVPNYYELDDFQVRTPTDIIGQHIHLVKFDVTSSDGAANGFNYEDGTLSPQEVQEVIHNINNGGGLFQSFAFDPATAKTLTAKPIPYFGNGPDNQWLGAQATIQRWYADPILGKVDNQDFDRTLRTVFTHDHFGPSTHQQAGLYAGLLVEPEGSRWQDTMNGSVFLGTNLNRPLGADGKPPNDGGPTSWQANIVTANTKDSYREFALEFADRQLAYKRNSPPKATPYKRYPGGLCPPSAPAIPFWGWADPTNAINPPTNGPGPCFDAPFPSIVTLSFDTGTYSMSYRNEAPAIRVNPNIGSPTQLQADLSHVFRSIPRADPSLNTQPTGQINVGCVNTPTSPCFTYPPVQVGAGNLDPYTLLLRAYEGDQVQIRTLVGAHMSPHSFTVHGINWLFEPTVFNATDNVSGYRGAQGMGISEHYEMLFSLPRTNPPSSQEKPPGADYFYSSSSDRTGLSFGNWGIMRAYRNLQPPGAPLVPLPNNKPPATDAAVPAAPAICPRGGPSKDFKVAAVFARDVIGSPVVYNSRGKSGQGGGEQIVNWNALAYFLEEDLDPVTGKLLPGKPVEPLILRANAGDCINVTLKNMLPNKALNAGATSVFGIPVYTSPEVGLHPQQVAFDVTTSNGVNVGNNPPITVPVRTDPSQPYPTRTYTWYAGRVEQQGGGSPKYIPIEFGSIPLTPSDPLMQHPYGLIGSLIIEPAGTRWQTDSNSRASANICKGDCSGNNLLFREFVLAVQDDNKALSLTEAGAAGAGPINGADANKRRNSTPAPGGYQGLNYRSEPLDYRYAADDWNTSLDSKSPLGVARALSNTLVGADPQTPVFAAARNMPLRFRMIHPAGVSEQVFTLHGHVWQEEPYTNGSREIGKNSRSQYEGSRDGFGPNIAFDAVIDSAGGAAGVTGDYLYRGFVGNSFNGGFWGLLRVGSSDIVTITKFSAPATSGGKVLIAGVNTVDPNTGKMAKQVTVFNTTGGAMNKLGDAEVDEMTGVWPKSGKPLEASSAVKSILVRSDEKGEASLSNYITVPGQTPSAQASSRRPADRRPSELDLFNPAPKQPEKRIQVGGTNGVQLTVVDPDTDPDNAAQTPAGTQISVSRGEPIIVSVKDGEYSLTFSNGAQAKQFFYFEIGGSPFSERRNKVAIGTAELGAGSVLARLTVRKDVKLSKIECVFASKDGQTVKANFVLK